jgi:hypothetical protein
MTISLRRLPILAAATLLLAGCSSTPAPRACNYEYKIVRSYVDSDLENQINSLAKEGWRVASSVEKPAPEVNGAKLIVFLERCTK